MRNFLLCGIIGAVLLIAIAIGHIREDASKNELKVARCSAPHRERPGA